MKLCLTLLFLLCVVFNCHARPDGAPKSACSSLRPVHYSFTPQESSPPYTVSAVKSGNKVRVTVSSPIGEEIQGFMLQARSANDRTKFIDGEFASSDEAKAVDCFAGQKNTLTHINAAPKKVIETEWTANDAVNEEVVFRATVAKSFSIFWTEVDSAPIKLNDGSPEAGKNSDIHSMYDDCFGSKGCFGLPSGCAQKGDCEVLFTYVRTPTGIQFDMQGYLDASRYMAMGLSNDNKMGEDSVTECIRDGSDVVVRESWNEGKSNTRTKELPKDQYSSSFADGLSSCSWMKPYVFESNGQQYDLTNKNYYVLLAKGEVENGRLAYHDEKLPSSIPVNFTAFEAIEGEGVSESVKVHGVSDASTEFQYTPTASLADEHEAKSTSASKITPAEEHKKNNSNCSSQLSFALLLLVLFELFYAVKGNLYIFASSA